VDTWTKLQHHYNWLCGRAN